MKHDFSLTDQQESAFGATIDIEVARLIKIRSINAARSTFNALINMVQASADADAEVLDLLAAKMGETDAAVNDAISAKKAAAPAAPIEPEIG